MAVPVSAVAPITDDVPKIGDVLEEGVDEASEDVGSDEEALLDREAVDDARLELDSERLEEEVPDELPSDLTLEELEVSSSLELVEVLLTEVNVVGDEEAVAATETAEATDPIIDVTWV